MSARKRRRGSIPKIEQHGRRFSFRFRGQRYSYGTETEATTELHRMLAELAKHGDREREGIPFEAAARRWLRSKLSATPNQRAQWEGIIDNHLVPYFGNRDLGSIARDDLSEFFNRKLGKNGAPLPPVKEGSLAHNVVSAQTAAHIYGVLRGTFRNEVRRTNGRIQDETEGLDIGAIRSERRQPIGREDMANILALMPPEFRTLIQLKLNLGLRLGEVLGLRIADWDSKTKMLHLSQQLKKKPTEKNSGKKAGWELGSLKTLASEDHFMLSDRLAALLDEHLAQLKRSKTENPLNLIFPSGGGKKGYITPTNLRTRVWLPAVCANRLQTMDDREQLATVESLPKDLAAIGWLLTLPGMSIAMARAAKWDDLTDQGLTAVTADGESVVFELDAALRSRLEVHRAEQKLSGRPNHHGYITVATYSRPPARRDIAQALKKAIENAGHTVPVLHSLRVSFVSTKIASGEDLVSVSKAARHSSKSTTANRYAAEFKKAQLRPVDTFDLYNPDGDAAEAEAS